MIQYSDIFNAQKQFFATGATKSIKYRKEVLKKLYSLIHSNEDKLNEAIYKDFKKSIIETYTTELSLIYAEIQYFIKNIDRLCKPIKRGTNMANIPAKFRIIREPMGCILIIGAWNYPYQLTLLPMIDAIAAGNTCIVKPSELPENTMHTLAELINNNFPKEYLYVAEGGAKETTELLKLHYDKIFFTGSTKVGKIVYEAASHNLTPVTLEMGGKSPVIVTEKADIKTAAKRIVWGKFLNAGQTCVAPDYLYAHESIRQKLLEELKHYIKQFEYGYDTDNYVQIINNRHFDRLAALIDKDKIYCGGKIDKNKLYIEPTILQNISWEDAVMNEEIFGPILPVLSFTSLKDIFEKIRSMEKPLAAYLFSNDKIEQQNFLTEISSGGVCINDVIMHIVNESVPFGGIGNSGIGNYHGEYGFNNFSHHKTVLMKPTCFENNIKYPPYNSKKTQLIKKLI